MRCIVIRRTATLYQVIVLALAFSLSAIQAAGHTHPETPAVEGSAGKPAPAAIALEERLGELHSAVLHFPIAMLVSAALSEALLAATGRESLRHVTRFVIWIGALGAVSAAPSRLAGG
ncbi:MAG TPA: hypothetical protein DEP35_14880 [Deltaproteobacteria bacterium]|nr:hypothetical protein [Deltaproteobacteria bacterium]